MRPLRPPLWQQFQGTLLGAALGWQWGHVAQNQQDWREVAGENHQLALSHPQPDHPSINLELLPLLPLLEHSWEQIRRQAEPPSEPGWLNLTAIDQVVNQPSPVKVFMASLPMALFWHEQLAQLRVALGPGFAQAFQPSLVGNRVNATHHPWIGDLELSVIAFNTLIALILQGYPPGELPSALIDTLHRHPLEPKLLQELEQLFLLVDQRTSLASAQITLKANTVLSVPVALGILSFLTTPNNFSLAVQRLTHLDQDQFPLAPLIAGSLTGAYLGRTGISPLKPNDATKSLLKLGAEIFCCWAGADAAIADNLDVEGLAIARPGLIRHQRYNEWG